MASPLALPTSSTPLAGRGYARNLAGQAAARLLYMAASFGVFVLVARLADGATLGRYSLVLAAVSLAIAAADFGTTTLIGADLARGEAGERPAYLGAVLIARLALGLLAGGGLAVATLWLPAALVPAMLAAAALCPLVAARFYDPIFQICARPSWTAWLSLLYGTVLAGLSLAALLLAAEPGAWLAAALVAAGTAYGVAGLLLLARLSAIRFAGAVPMSLALLRRAAPIGIATVIGMANARIGVVVLSAWSGPAETGVYAAAFRLFELGAAVAVTVTTPLIPVLVASHAASPDAFRAKLRRALALAGCAAPFAAAVPLAAPALAALLYGPGMALAASLLPAMAWLCVLSLHSMILFAALVAEGRQRTAVPVAVAALGANALACGLLIPGWGAAGATAGALAAECVTFAANAVLAAREGVPADAAAFGAALAAAVAIALAVALLPAGLAVAVAAGLAALGIRPALRLQRSPAHA